MSELTPQQKRIQTMKERYGKDWAVKQGKVNAAKIKARNPGHYRDMAYKSQEVYLSKPREERKPRGFASNPALAREVGARGGEASKRGPNKEK